MGWLRNDLKENPINFTEQDTRMQRLVQKVNSDAIFMVMGAKLKLSFAHLDHSGSCILTDPPHYITGGKRSRGAFIFQRDLATSTSKTLEETLDRHAAGAAAADDANDDPAARLEQQEQQPPMTPMTILQHVTILAGVRWSPRSRYPGKQHGIKRGIGSGAYTDTMILSRRTDRLRKEICTAARSGRRGDANPTLT